MKTLVRTTSIGLLGLALGVASLASETNKEEVTEFGEAAFAADDPLHHHAELPRIASLTVEAVPDHAVRTLHARLVQERPNQPPARIEDPE